jgi:TRAP-type C4-dicarboxylate transport system substrate-binding protein
VTTNVPSPTSIVGLIMNKASWEALPADQQAALDRLTGREFSIEASILWSRKDVDALTRARTDKGITVIDLPDQEREAFDAAAQTAISAHLDQLEKEGIHARDIYQAFKR